jgi:site-specific recombinase XerD
MSPLRERMIEDMTLAGLALGTRQAYTQAVRRLAARYRRSPDQLSEDEVRGYLLELRQQGAARGTFKIGLYGLRFFYQHTLGRGWELFREKKDRRTWAEAAASRAVGGSGPATARPRP